MTQPMEHWQLTTSRLKTFARHGHLVVAVRPELRCQCGWSQAITGVVEGSAAEARLISGLYRTHLVRGLEAQHRARLQKVARKWGVGA